MVSKCANPSCAAVFRYLHEGTIFHVATTLATRQGTDRERFWLCAACSKTMTVISQAGRVMVVPLGDRSEIQKPAGNRRAVAVALESTTLVPAI
jgi:hypothetical protein